MIVLDPPAVAPIAHAVSWVSATMLGTIAATLCVIAVAAVGLLMITGRLPVRHAFRVILGCFLIFGSPIVANALFALVTGAAPLRLTPAASSGSQRDGLPPASYDPYAGASLRRD